MDKIVSKIIWIVALVAVIVLISVVGYGYYKKAPKHLNLDEASMLAGVLNAPSVYAPTVNPDLAKKRQYHVLKTMVEYGYITNEQSLSIK